MHHIFSHCIINDIVHGAVADEIDSASRALVLVLPLLELVLLLLELALPLLLPLPPLLPLLLDVVLLDEPSPHSAAPSARIRHASSCGSNAN